MVFKYKKVIVIGNNGSGKSYFSKKLAKISGLPLVHLDKIYWRENWEHPTRDEWAKIQENLLKKDEFIIDGMYISTLEMRFSQAELIIFLDIDLSTCIDAIKTRENVKRDDFPEYLEQNQEKFQELLNGAYEFEEKRKPRIFELKNKYQNKDFVVFYTREEADKYLEEIAEKI